MNWFHYNYRKKFLSDTNLHLIKSCTGLPFFCNFPFDLNLFSHQGQHTLPSRPSLLSHAVSAASLHSATKAFSNPVKRLCPFTIVVDWKRQSLRENIAYKASIHLDTQSSTMCKCTTIFTRPVFSVFASRNNIFEYIDADKTMVVNLQFIRVTQGGVYFMNEKAHAFLLLHTTFHSRSTSCCQSSSLLYLSQLPALVASYLRGNR